MPQIGNQRPEALAAETARVFFALWPEQAVRAQFMQWAKLLHETCDGNISKPGNLHITLAFLGNVEVSRLDELKLLASRIGGSAFSLEFSAPGYWRHNRIAWAAPDQTPPVLSDLVQNIESSLRAARFKFDERPYAPHLTLLRKARWDPPQCALKSVNWKISEFTLVRSNRMASGSHYEIIGRWPLFLEPASTQEPQPR